MKGRQCSADAETQAAIAAIKIAAKANIKELRVIHTDARMLAEFDINVKK